MTTTRDGYARITATPESIRREEFYYRPAACCGEPLGDSVEHWLTTDRRKVHFRCEPPKATS